MGSRPILLILALALAIPGAAMAQGDYENAVRWYAAAAEQGYAGAQDSLGVMFSRGEGVVENCSTAAHWFELAAAQAYPAAISNLRTLSCVRLV